MSHITPEQFTAAFEALSREAGRTQQLLDASKVFGDAAAIIGRVNEAATTLENIKSQIQKAHEDLNAAQAEVAKAKEESARITADAWAIADEAKKQAEAEAAQIREKAVDDSIRVVEAAQAQAAAMIKAASEKVNASRVTEAKHLEASESLAGEIKSRRTELDAVEAKLHSVRESISKALGGVAHG